MDEIEKSTEQYSQLGYSTTKKRAFQMKVPRLHGRPFVIRQLLALIAIVSIFVLLFTCFHTSLESSYLDLVDSFLPETAAGYVPPVENPESQTSDESNSNAGCRDDWIVEWISSGVMPKCSLASHNKIDLLYTWVNGSETLYQSEKKRWQDKSPVFGGSGITHDRKLVITERRHREHDELRYSIRSAFKYLDNSFSSIRILASDFLDGKKWIGQIPTWLDLEAGKEHSVSMMYTSELYGKNSVDLPVFSSLSLESRFANVPVPDHGNDVMVYMNDDMFFASKHTVSDFWNPILGLNLQVDYRSWVENQDPSVEEFQRDWNSEWTALRYSNHLLSERFGTRRRVYVAHFGKPLSRTILKEVEKEFNSDIVETSKHRFRSEGKEVNTIFLHAHYLMERHREILLESFLVHRSDANSDGALDMEERRVILAQIEDALKSRGVRKSLEQCEKGMNISNLPLPKVTKPVWSSSDGFPFALYTSADASAEPNIRAVNRPMYGLKDLPHMRNPDFDFVEMCLTEDFAAEHLSDVKVDAKMLFRILAKDYPYCGDMLLAILIPSRETGLHHLLPPPSHKQYNEVVKQLHRYAYTISYVESEFIMAKSAETLQRGFNKVMRTLKWHTVSQFCVNDDVESTAGTTVQRMDSLFKGILQGYFGGMTPDRGRSPVEKEETVEDINAAGREFWSSQGANGGPGYQEEAAGVVVK